MSSPLIETKLHHPSLRRNLVARGRLGARLQRAADARSYWCRLPPASARPRSIAEWLRSAAGDGSTVAWLSLDERTTIPQCSGRTSLRRFRRRHRVSGGAQALFWTTRSVDGGRAGEARQRVVRRQRRRLSGARRSPRHRSQRHSRRVDLPRRPPSRACSARGHQPGGPSVAVGSPASGSAANSSRSGPPICASPPRKRRNT